jgi:subtilisin family serine protease
MRSSVYDPISSAILAVAISLLFVATSFALLATNDSRFEPSATTSNATEPPEPTIQKSVLDWSQTDWDWPSFADDMGYVEVIVSDPMSAYGVSSSSGYSYESLVRDDKDGAADTSNTHRDFSVGFRGFSAHLSIEELDQLLTTNPSLQAYPDLPVKITVSSNLVQVGADQVWTYHDSYGKAVKGSGITVAVIDTGVDYTHPDLGGGFGTGYKVVGGYDFFNNDANPIDDNGHGTHVAGIIAANGGSYGVAPEASILAYKVLGADGWGRMSTVITGIEAAMDPNGDGNTNDHANVISLSLGGEGNSDDPVCLAVKSAVDAGVVVVVAAGNSGPTFGTVGSPGLAPEAITVGAVDHNGLLASFSSRGSASDFVIKPEISAPGVSISSTVPYSGTEISSPSGYLALSGTSMATPHVSGAAALLLQLHPDWSPAQVKSALITGVQSSSNSLWQGGAGVLWIPDSASSVLMFPQPIVAYGYPSEVGLSFTVESLSATALTLTASTSDWRSLEVNGSACGRTWANVSSISPSSLNIAAQGESSATIVIAVPSSDFPEGFYEGSILLKDASHDVRIPFAYVLVSRLNVHLFDISGKEFIDNRGGVWVYAYPGAERGYGQSDRLTATTPVSFLLPSGTYSVHALGHQLLYFYSSPYFLSKVVSIGRMQTLDLNLMMSDARQMILNLTTDGGQPIFVIDFVMWGRYSGSSNVSFDVSYVDSLIRGESVFHLAKSRMIYVTDTVASVGISLTGFSYSPGLWDFMTANSDHWFEFANCTLTEFRPEATADLKYLLSWEFDGIDATTPLELGVQEGVASTYLLDYDIPGSIGNIWGYAGGHMAMGADASFYLRRGSFVSVNPFFSGMTRRTIVQGVYSVSYWPGSIYEGSFEEIYNVPDYSHVKKVTNVPGAYMPDTNYLVPISDVSDVGRIGAGPFYPSVRTFNTNNSMVLVHPLLRDQSGAAVQGPFVPKMYVYHDGAFFYSRDLSEFGASPSAERIATLTDQGAYLYSINYSTGFEICSQVALSLYFVLPSIDVNPPQITGMSMSQRFVPGQAVPLTLTAVDDRSLSTIEVSWRSGNAGSWISLPVSSLGHGDYFANIQTKTSDSRIDLRIRATDSSGNFLEYSASNASLRQIPVLFDLSVSPQYVPYNSTDATVVLSGRLTDMNGNPLCAYGSIPLELMVDGRKVALILDDYTTQDTHVHNGTIRFEWRFNPIHLFESPVTDAEVLVTFDLGVYEPVVRTLTLHPQKLVNNPPGIELVSPSNNSLIAAGQVIDLTIEDDGPFTVDATVDGISIGQLHSPWNVDTTSWNDGTHVLRIIAVDDQSLTASASFNFDVDAQAPSVRIHYPKDGGRVPMGSILTAEVTDARLADAYYSVDGGSPKALVAPYEIDMATWEPHVHTVAITATDLVGHVTSCSASFEIVNSSIAVQLENPTNGGVVRSGIPIKFSVSGSGTITSRWCTVGVWQELGGLTTIPTDGWFEGVHSIIINSTSDLGAFDQVTFTVTIDDTSPLILLNSPSDNSFVSPSGNIRFQVFDANIETVNWTIWGRSYSTAQSEIVLPLTSPPSDGYFDVNVTAVDRAGNEAKATFRFAMDSSPPVVSFEDWSSGDAIRPGHQLNFTATDAFLSMVQSAIDGGALAEMSSPFAVNTSSLSGGIHQLTVVASDLSGKKTTANISFYVDGVAPNVIITSSSRMTLNATCTVTASVSDDYGVAFVQLLYELQGGGYGSVMMAGYDDAYVAQLAPNLLWRGMTIYVLATDKVGNVAESPHMTLLPATSPVDGNLPLPGSPSGWGAATWAWIVSTNGLATLGSIGVLALAGVVLYARRRREDESTEGAVKPKPSPRSVSNASPFAELPPPMQVAAVSARQIVDSVKAVAKTVGQVPMPTRVPTAVASGSGAPARVLLLDSIPEIALRPDVKSPEDDIDYGELIERELNTSAWKNSAFGKGIEDSAFTRESDVRPDRPGIISGLKLKQILG